MQKQIEAVITAHLGQTFPACSLSVWRRDAMLFEGAWGWVDPDAQTLPVQPDTLFDLASLTKLFTTTAFLQAASRGQVGLDDPLSRVVLTFAAVTPRPLDGGQDPHTKQHLPTPAQWIGQTVDPTRITFRHLLTHTSGLPPWRDVYQQVGAAPPPPTEPDSIPREVRWARALDVLVQYPCVAPPDGVVRYSDIGLMLLGEAVTRLSGQPDLAAALQQQVLEPLGTAASQHLCFNPVREQGIDRSRIAPTEADPLWRKRRVWGEVHDENSCGLGGVTGHAGLFGTASAVARLGVAWLDRAQVFGITPQLAQAACTLQAETQGTRRGLGFALRAAVDSMAGDLMSMDAFGHSGFTGTTLWMDPAAQIVVALLTNSVYYGRMSQGYEATHHFRRSLHDAVMQSVKG
jgi:serine-type D-Ala-D-Ala carboxypeptidase